MKLKIIKLIIKLAISILPIIISKDICSPIYSKYLDLENVDGAIFKSQVILVIIILCINVIDFFFRDKESKKWELIEDENKAIKNTFENYKEKVREYLQLRQNIDLIFKYHLISISQTLQIKNTERISLYIVKEHRFIRCARYSPNNNYNKPGRPSYPLGEGVIGKAWMESECYRSKLPDYELKEKEYLDIMNEDYNLPAEVIKNLNMHSRMYYGFRISDNDNSNHNGVIIIESIKKSFSSQKKMHEVLSRNKICLFKLIRDFNNFIPTSEEELTFLINHK